MCQLNGGSLYFRESLMLDVDLVKCAFGRGDALKVSLVSLR